MPHSAFGAGELIPNRLTITLQPEERISLQLMNKTPGLTAEGMRLSPLSLDLSLTEAFSEQRRRIAYERLILDVLAAIRFFVRADEVETAWTWIDGIAAAWEETGSLPEPYAAGSRGPAAADALIARGGYLGEGVFRPSRFPPPRLRGGRAALRRARRSAARGAEGASRASSPPPLRGPPPPRSAGRIILQAAFSRGMTTAKLNRLKHHGSVNPFTGEAVQRHREMTRDEVDAAIAGAQHDHLEWRHTSFAHRAELMRKAAALLDARAEEYGRLMAVEMGKPIRDGIAEAKKCAVGCNFYAEHAEKYLAPQPVELDGGRKARVVFNPLGVLLAVMPWNFPFWQVIRFAAPALMAGNAGVLKHAANVQGCALALEQLFRDAGFPEHLFRTLLIVNKAVEHVIEHPFIRAVSLTGSSGAGRAVAGVAGRCLKKCVLELGGSDAYLVLEDSDIAFAAALGAKGRLVNGGQSCIAAKRFIVIESRRAEFERALTAEMAKAKMGDPLDETTTLGPMARRDLRDSLHEQVRRSVERGARCLLGGEIPAGAGRLLSADRAHRCQEGHAGL